MRRMIATVMLTLAFFAGQMLSVNAEEPNRDDALKAYKQVLANGEAANKVLSDTVKLRTVIDNKPAKLGNTVVKSAVKVWFEILDADRNAAPTIDGDIVKTANHTAAAPDEMQVAQKSVKFRGGVIANPDDVAFAEEDLMSFDNLVRFSSCRKGQQSLEDGKAGHGIFTKFVLEALDGKADEQTVTVDNNGKTTVSNGDGEINFFELTDYVTRNTQDYVKKQYGGKFAQKPSMSASETSVAVIMGYTGETRTKVKLDDRQILHAANQGDGRVPFAEKVARASAVVDTIRRVGAPIPSAPSIPFVPRFW